MSAVSLLREAADTGVDLAPRPDGTLQARFHRGAASPDLLAQLRAHKAELVEILTGWRCRHCGQRLAWPAPVGVTHGDGRASCFSCYYEQAAHRAVEAHDALVDEAELMLHGEPLP